jgi:hypothetical protein
MRMLPGEPPRSVASATEPAPLPPPGSRFIAVVNGQINEQLWQLRTPQGLIDVTSPRPLIQGQALHLEVVATPQGSALRLVAPTSDGPVDSLRSGIAGNSSPPTAPANSSTSSEPGAASLKAALTALFNRAAAGGTTTAATAVLASQSSPSSTTPLLPPLVPPAITAGDRAIGERLPVVLLESSGSNKPLPPGAILVTRAAQTAAAGEPMTLPLADRQIVVQLPKAVAAGQRLLLQVAAADRGPQLQLLPSPLGDSSELAARALRQSLPLARPLQESLMPLLAALQMSRDLPPSVNQSLSQLLNNLPRLEGLLLPEGLATALANSGHNFEHKLLLQNLPDSDLKLILLRIAHAIRQSLQHDGKFAKEVLREQLFKILEQVEASLARMTRLQLATLPEEKQQENDRQWYLELPYLNPKQEPHLLRLRVDHHSRRCGGGEDEDEWVIRLQLPSGDHGEVAAVVHWLSDALQVTFLSLLEETRDKIAHHLPDLAKRLQELGIGHATLVSQRGAIDFEPPPPRRNGHLVSERV